MSDHCPYKPFKLMLASICKHLGEFADLWMQQKIVMLQKTVATHCRSNPM
jgi:hypothetical protein